MVVEIVSSFEKARELDFAIFKKNIKVTTDLKIILCIFRRKLEKII